MLAQRLVSIGSSLILLAAYASTPLVASELKIADSLRVPARTTKQLNFTVRDVSDAPHHLLAFRARLEAPRRGGYAYALRITLNGHALDVSKLVNKLPYEERVDGTIKTSATAGGVVFAAEYSDRFVEVDNHPNYALKSRRSVFEFVFDVSGLVREGKNELVVKNSIPSPLQNALILDSLLVRHANRIARPVSPRARMAGSPPLWRVRPHPANSDVEVTSAKDGYIDVLLPGGQRFRCRSEFSTPDGGWVHGSSRWFRHSRQVRRQGEAIIVVDTFTNLADEDVPIIQRHTVWPVDGDGKRLRWRRFWVCGLSPESRLVQSEPANPTSFGTTETAGLGLLPLNDVFLVHSRNAGMQAQLVLEDPLFVLRKGSSYRAEWAIVVVDRGTLRGTWGENTDNVWSSTNEPYFWFVNAVRRLRGANFTLDGPFAFLRADPRYTGRWSDEEIVNFARWKSAKFLCSSIDYPRYKGRYPHGTAFQLVDHSYRKTHLRRLRRLLPDVQHLVYFHCYIDPRDDAPQLYRDSRLLMADGRQATYGRDYERLFVPYDGSSFQQAVERNIAIILDEIGADGVYWDEIEYSRYRYHYGQPWDGVTGDIHAATHKLIRKKSSVTLLTQRWRVDLARRILSRGPLVANGQPHTRTMAALKFPRFVETGSISNCRRAHLFSPIALGDHLTERSEQDAYRVMLWALDFGCLYYWYNDLLVRPTHPHLTAYMYPCTPVELHEGVILGRERIITNRTGIYTWDDGSEHEVHVFGRDAREVSVQARGRYARTYKRDGVTYTELRLPDGFSAAIVRRR